MREPTEHSTLRLSGEIDITLPGGVVARLASAELVRKGAMAEPEGAFHLTLGGRLDELRKLAAASPAIASMLGHAASEDGARSAELRLVAPPHLIEDLARVEDTHGDVTMPNQLLEDPAWMSLAFALDRYEAESIGIVTEEWHETTTF